MRWLHRIEAERIEAQDVVLNELKGKTQEISGYDGGLNKFNGVKQKTWRCMERINKKGR